MSDDTSADHAWRAEMLDDLASGDASRSTRALLSLTYNDPDRSWVEELLLGQLREGNDPQLRSLAVTCMGHLGRMRGIVSARLFATLEGLLGDPVLGGIAEDALGDVKHFATVL
ncbi:hypothetical protein V2S66_30425 [Streptomyces sp. V4-01]|uniref:HEAT repeat domain-containing protein n=1 Tax=Actinacidiphila polyblastidii TaxID=3110430 RepID=A0ABU7PKL1_9ACTN|nr:hypothetical protein [Streptomyces sp. V4-01]